MNDQIKYLIELQNIDSKIISNEDQKQRLPQELEEEKLIYEDFQYQISELGKELKNLQVQRKEKEIDLGSKESQVKKLQLQLYQIKTNREYSSLQNEINSAKADNSIMEEEILDLLDKIDKKQDEIKEKKAELSDKEQTLDVCARETNDKIVNLDQELNGLRKQREEITSRIEKSILSKYEKILRNKRGSLAMAPIRDSSCQGCFMNLPPQVINEVKLGNRIVICENCSRILYIEN